MDFALQIVGLGGRESQVGVFLFDLSLSAMATEPSVDSRRAMRLFDFSSRQVEFVEYLSVIAEVMLLVEVWGVGESSCREDFGLNCSTVVVVCAFHALAGGFFLVFAVIVDDGFQVALVRLMMVAIFPEELQEIVELDNVVVKLEFDTLHSSDVSDLRSHHSFD